MRLSDRNDHATTRQQHGHSAYTAHAWPEHPFGPPQQVLRVAPDLTCVRNNTRAAAMVRIRDQVSGRGWQSFWLKGRSRVPLSRA
eukprot:5311982-Prymnesium_polylepis.1